MDVGGSPTSRSLNLRGARCNSRSVSRSD
jgi:hypothetical protein